MRGGRSARLTGPALVGEASAPTEAGAGSEKLLDQACLNRALRFLAPRPRSEHEVRRRLTDKGEEPDRIERAILKLRELKLLDDRAFAAYWLENRAAFKPRGARGLRGELLQKGVARDTVEQALDDADRDELEDAYRAAARSAQRLRSLGELDFRQRLAQHLQRRGFGWDAIDAAVTRHWRERATD